VTIIGTLYDHDMPSVPVILLYFLAVARVTTLITMDEITRPVREGLVKRFNAHLKVHRWIVYLLGGADDNAEGCPWCMSIWVAALTAPLLWHHSGNPYFLVPMLAFSASQVTGMIFRIGRQ
jgi:hypothetical protein